MIETLSLQDVHLTPGVVPDQSPVLAAELEGLPAPVRRYFDFMRVVGRPRVWSFRGEWRGRFRIKAPDEWRRCEAWQYNTRFAVTRAFRIRVHPRPLVSVVARDTYEGGHGRMHVKLYDWLELEDATGPELDVGELVTYANDAILLAPSMLLGPETSWTFVDDASFDVSLTDAGHTVTGRVDLDERGAPLEFTTSDRYYRDPADPERPWQRTRWSTPIEGWELTGGPPRLTGARATWHLPAEDFTYAELWPNHERFAYNVRPGG